MYFCRPVADVVPNRWHLKATDFFECRTLELRGPRVAHFWPWAVACSVLARTRPVYLLYARWGRWLALFV